MKTELSLEERVKAIEARNAKVEADKAWEVSYIRRFSITVLTYFVIVIYLVFINKDSHPFINAIVPAVGYFVSTLVMRGAKEYWQSRRKND
jgi:hypothetical protein